jgi:hypothetical protein
VLVLKPGKLTFHARFERKQMVYLDLERTSRFDDCLTTG